MKGRGRVAVRFHQLTADGERYSIRTRPRVASAPGTKKRDLATIAVPAAGGAVIGAIADGKKGAGIGAAIGGGAGTGVVLATRGKEVRLSRGRGLACTPDLASHSLHSVRAGVPRPFARSAEEDSANLRRSDPSVKTVSPEA